MLKIFLFLFIGISIGSAQNLRIIPLYTIDNKNSSLNLNHPKGISVDSNGHLYVSDSENHRVLKLDQKGNILSQVGGIGWGKEQFQNPLGLFVYNTMDVFVADQDNNRIVRFDKNLNWITELSAEFHWQNITSFSFPRDIYVSFHGDYFIIDGEDRGIIKLDSGFSPLLAFGGYDWGKGSLSDPASIFLSSMDHVLVSDRASSCIFVYDYYGNFLYHFGKPVLKNPGGIFIHKNDLIFVTDDHYHSLFVFDKEGHLLHKFGHYGKKIGSFNFPVDVAVHNNKIYVLESVNNRIQVFSFVSAQ